MTSAVPAITLPPRDYDAVLLDLDGVPTRSASVHAAAWRKLFDGFLQQRAARTGEAVVPFDIATDYLRHVDGKDVTRFELKGEPAPDALLEAARRLGAEPAITHRHCATPAQSSSTSFGSDVLERQCHALS